jgi:hypothetical protein
MITLTAKITLADGKEISLDKRNMLNIEQTIIDRDNINLPSFGIISNGGFIEFSDYDGRVLDYAESGDLNEGLKCAIFVNNTIRKIERQVALFETSQWNYDSNSKIVRVSIKDDLEEWQDIFVEGINYDARDLDAKPLKYFYEYLYSKTPSLYNMVAFNNLDTKTKEILESTFVKYPLLKGASLWQQWNKLCMVSQAHIFKKGTGNIIFVYNEGD